MLIHHILIRNCKEIYLRTWDYKGGPVVKSEYSPSKGLKFSSQHPLGVDHKNPEQLLQRMRHFWFPQIPTHKGTCFHTGIHTCT